MSPLPGASPAHLIDAPDSRFSKDKCIVELFKGCGRRPALLSELWAIPVPVEVVQRKRKEAVEIKPTKLNPHEDLTTFVKVLLLGACVCGPVAMWVKPSSCREEWWSLWRSRAHFGCLPQCSSNRYSSSCSLSFQCAGQVSLFPTWLNVLHHNFIQRYPYTELCSYVPRYDRPPTEGATLCATWPPAAGTHPLSLPRHTLNKLSRSRFSSDRLGARQVQEAICWTGRLGLPSRPSVLSVPRLHYCEKSVDLASALLVSIRQKEAWLPLDGKSLSWFRWATSAKS